jgi:oxygen-dependent protoporphyrinogen oxidase
MKTKPEIPIVVIGAGISGLAAARSLGKAGQPVVILESNRRIGGRILTDRLHGFEIDAGAQFLTSFYTHTLGLIRELDLQGDLVRIPGVAAILREGRLYKIWPDARAIFTGLMSAWSKLLLLRPVFHALAHWRRLDLHALHKAAALDTASVAAYTAWYMNAEVLEYILQPPLSGILYWEPEHTSQAMLFVMLKVAPGIRLLTLKHGMGQLPAAMAAGLEIELGAAVTQVLPGGAGGYLVKYERDGQSHEMLARAVVCSIPACLVPGIFPHLTDPQRRFFQAIEYSQNTIAAVGLDHRPPENIYGILFPRREAKHLAIAAVQSAKNPQQLPAGQELIVLYPNGAAGRRLIEQPDERIFKVLTPDLELAGSIYHVGDAPLFQRVYRWPQALPFFDVGHFKRLKDFHHGAVESGRLVFCGDYLGGPLVEGAVSSGYQAAERLLARLG